MNQRFYSLDVFRGATVAFMIMVNNPGSWQHLYAPLGHASWHGCTPTDLVFPFFLFAVGNALSFVMPRLEAAGTSAFLKKVVTRSAIIFGIGLFLQWFPFVRWSNDELVFIHWVNPDNPERGVRIIGVLGRIALCYFFASFIIYFFKIRGALVISFILLLGYWALCLLFGDPADPYSLQGYFGLKVDKAILGIPHMYRGEGVPFDPEGLASTLTSIVQVIFGYFVGYYIQQKGKTYEMLSHLFIAASILIFTGYAWDMSFPINKKIWTSSYVLYTTGLAIMILCFLLFLIEFKKVQEKKLFTPTLRTNLLLAGGGLILAGIISGTGGIPFLPVLLSVWAFTAVVFMLVTGNWSKFFDVFGKNALFIYVLSGFLPRVLGLVRWVDHIDEGGKKVYITPMPWFYEHICKPVSSNLKNGSLLYAVCLIGFFWLIGYWMDKKKIYIKV